MTVITQIEWPIWKKYHQIHASSMVGEKYSGFYNDYTQTSRNRLFLFQKISMRIYAVIFMHFFIIKFKLARKVSWLFSILFNVQHCNYLLYWYDRISTCEWNVFFFVFFSTEKYLISTHYGILKLFELWRILRTILLGEKNVIILGMKFLNEEIYCLHLHRSSNFGKTINCLSLFNNRKTNKVLNCRKLTSTSTWNWRIKQNWQKRKIFLIEHHFLKIDIVLNWVLNYYFIKKASFISKFISVISKDPYLTSRVFGNFRNFRPPMLRK